MPAKSIEEGTTIKRILDGGDVARIWGVTLRGVQRMLKHGDFAGAYQDDLGRWHVPVDSIFIKKHANAVYWGRPYHEGGEWLIDGYSKNGLQIYRLILL